MTLVLGPLERSHLQELQRWRNSPALRAHTRGTRLLSYADQLAWYERQRTDPNTRMWAVSDSAYWRNAAPLAICGVAGLCHIDWINRAAELSLYVTRDGFFEDFAAEAEVVRLLCAEAFDGLGLHRVWAEVYGTVPDRRRPFHDTLDQVGSIPHCVYRNGAWHDAALYSLTEEQWHRTRGIGARHSSTASAAPPSPDSSSSPGAAPSPPSSPCS